MLQPPGRGTAWRKGFKTPPDYNDNGYNCGGKGVNTIDKVSTRYWYEFWICVEVVGLSGQRQLVQMCDLLCISKTKNDFEGIRIFLYNFYNFWICKVQHNSKNNHRCGVCGNEFSSPSKSNEPGPGNRYATGVIVAKYQAGQTSKYESVLFAL